MTSESALGWGRGYCRISSHEDGFVVQPRGKDTPSLVCCASASHGLRRVFFSHLALSLQHLCRCTPRSRTLCTSQGVRVSRPNLNTRSRVLGSQAWPGQLCQKCLGRSRRAFFSEHFDGITIDPEVARNKALLYNLWKAWLSMAKTLPRL